METKIKVPTVYIVNQSGHDTESARTYGELRVLSKDKINVFATDRIIAEFTEKMRDYNPKTDFILCSGSIVLNMIVMKIALAHGAKNVNTLLYNFHLERYVVRSI